MFFKYDSIDSTGTRKYIPDAIVDIGSNDVLIELGSIKLYTILARLQRHTESMHHDITTDTKDYCTNGRLTLN